MTVSSSPEPVEEGNCAAVLNFWGLQRLAQTDGTWRREVGKDGREAAASRVEDEVRRIRWRLENHHRWWPTVSTLFSEFSVTARSLLSTPAHGL